MAQPSAPPRLPNLALRVVSALVLLPLAVGVLWYGGWLLTGFLAAIAAAAAWEFSTMAGADGMPRLLCAAGLAAAPLLFHLLDIEGVAVYLALVFAATVILAVALQTARFVLLGLGALYICAALIGLSWLRQEAGLTTVLWIVAIVVATDVGAYFAGRSLGGPKLAPRISPAKTWSGLAGGMAAAAMSSWFVSVASTGFGSLQIIAAGAVLAVVAQCGDLIESAVKRYFGVKDAGRLIPGHGGVLDRLDGFLTVAPVVALVTWSADGSPLKWL